MAFGRSDLMVVLCLVLVILAPTRTHGLCWPECMRACDDLRIICGTACVFACMGRSPFYNHYESLIAVRGPAAAPGPAHRALLKLRDSPAYNSNGNSNGNGNSNNNKEKEETTAAAAPTTATLSSIRFSQFP